MLNKNFKKVLLASVITFIFLTALFTGLSNEVEAATGSGTNGTVSFCGPNKNDAYRPTCVTATCTGAYTWNNCTWTSTCTIGGVTSPSNWTNVSVTWPECYDGCELSKNVCSGDEVCQGTNCAPCPSGTVVHYGSAGKYCSNSCNADVPCNATLNSKYCRKIGGNWGWVAALTCTEGIFCQTTECCSSSSCESAVGSNKGYCGINSSGSLAWIISGSASCPYSISLWRDKYSYKMTSGCYDNAYGDYSDCDTGDFQASVRGIYPYSAALLLQKARVEAPVGEHGYYYMRDIESYAGPGNSSNVSLFPSTYNYWYPRYNLQYIVVDKANCCMPGTPGCLQGDTAPGDYTDIYKIGLLSASNSFSINCDPPAFCNSSSCGGGGFYCTNLPSNATVCSNDYIGLTSDVVSTVVNSCTTAVKCEFLCNAGYVKSGNSCVPSVVSPSLTFISNPVTITSGQSSTLTWTTANVTSCTATGGWTGAKSATGGSQAVSPTTTTTYNMECWSSTGTSTGIRSVTVNVVSVPTLALIANPNPIVSGQSSTLAWTTTNTSSCWGWSVPSSWDSWKSATGGSQAVSPTINTTYYMECWNSAGTSTGIKSVTVNVSSAPAVSLTANPNSINSGGSTDISWTPTNVTSCWATGGTTSWTDTWKSNTGGTLAFSPTATTTYSIECWNSTGVSTGIRSVTVNVVTAIPTLSLVADPNSVVSGGSTNISWTPTNVTSCWATGGTSGWTDTWKASTGGSQAVSPTTNTTYTMECWNDAGTSTGPQSIIVNVSAPAACTSFIPANAHTCSGDGTGPGDWHYATCSSATCEWQCNTGCNYNSSLNTCVCPLSGECGDAQNKSFCQAPPKSSLCSSGNTSSSVTLAPGNKWSWTCTGENDGSVTSCEALKDCSWKEVNP